MISVNSALQKILENSSPLPPVTLPLSKSLGHILGKDVVANQPLPSFSNSAMDGFAVRSNDLKRIPKILQVIEEIPAGKFPKQKVRAGTASRIMTGAPLPLGADAIVPVEKTALEKNESVKILAHVHKGQHIRSKGEELKKGKKIFSRGHLLKPADLGLLAALGITRIKVFPKPSVSIVTTGSEVVGISAHPKPGQIRNSNLISILSSVKQLGCSVPLACHIKDNLQSLEALIQKNRSNVLITCGGVSVGDYDFVTKVLEKMGKIIFWKVAMKPGKPFLFGKIGRSLFFGLPGNPVSSLVTFDILVKPALRYLSGEKEVFPKIEFAALTKNTASPGGRQEYIRARLSLSKKGFKIAPLPWQGSGMLRSLAHANAWILVPAHKKYRAGSIVPFIRQ